MATFAKADRFGKDTDATPGPGQYLKDDPTQQGKQDSASSADEKGGASGGAAANSARTLSLEVDELAQAASTTLEPVFFLLEWQANQDQQPIDAPTCLEALRDDMEDPENAVHDVILLSGGDLPAAKGKKKGKKDTDVAEVISVETIEALKTSVQAAVEEKNKALQESRAKERAELAEELARKDEDEEEAEEKKKAGKKGKDTKSKGKAKGKKGGKEEPAERAASAKGKKKRLLTAAEKEERERLRKEAEERRKTEAEKRRRQLEKEKRLLQKVQRYTAKVEDTPTTAPVHVILLSLVKTADDVEALAKAGIVVKSILSVRAEADPTLAVAADDADDKGKGKKKDAQKKKKKGSSPLEPLPSVLADDIISRASAKRSADNVLRDLVRTDTALRLPSSLLEKPPADAAEEKKAKGKGKGKGKPAGMSPDLEKAVLSSLKQTLPSQSRAVSSSDSMFRAWTENASTVLVPDAEATVDQRHYEHVLSQCPASRQSVPVILHAMLAQVEVANSDSPAAPNQGAAAVAGYLSSVLSAFEDDAADAAPEDDAGKGSASSPAPAKGPVVVPHGDTNGLSLAYDCLNAKGSRRAAASASAMDLVLQSAGGRTSGSLVGLVCSARRSEPNAHVVSALKDLGPAVKPLEVQWPDASDEDKRQAELTRVANSLMMPLELIERSTVCLSFQQLLDRMRCSQYNTDDLTLPWTDHQRQELKADMSVARDWELAKWQLSEYHNETTMVQVLGSLRPSPTARIGVQYLNLLDKLLVAYHTHVPIQRYDLQYWMTRVDTKKLFREWLAEPDYVRNSTPKVLYDMDGVNTGRLQGWVEAAYPTDQSVVGALCQVDASADSQEKVRGTAFLEHHGYSASLSWSQADTVPSAEIRAPGHRAAVTRDAVLRATASSTNSNPSASDDANNNDKDDEEKNKEDDEKSQEEQTQHEQTLPELGVYQVNVTYDDDVRITIRGGTKPPEDAKSDVDAGSTFHGIEDVPVPVFGDKAEQDATTEEKKATAEEVEDTGDATDAAEEKQTQAAAEEDKGDEEADDDAASEHSEAPTKPAVSVPVGLSVTCTAPSGLLVELGDESCPVRQSELKGLLPFGGKVSQPRSEPWRSFAIVRASSSEWTVVVHEHDAGRRTRSFDSLGGIVEYSADGEIVTLPDGSRVSRQAGKADAAMDAISVVNQVDPESHSQICTREDLTMVVEYKDKSRLVQYGDGTRMYTDIVAPGAPCAGPIATASHSPLPSPADLGIELVPGEVAVQVYIETPKLDPVLFYLVQAPGQQKLQLPPFAVCVEVGGALHGPVRMERHSNGSVHVHRSGLPAHAKAPARIVDDGFGQCVFVSNKLCTPTGNLSLSLQGLLSGRINAEKIPAGVHYIHHGWYVTTAPSACVLPRGDSAAPTPFETEQRTRVAGSRAFLEVTDDSDNTFTVLAGGWVKAALLREKGVTMADDEDQNGAIPSQFYPLPENPIPPRLFVLDRDGGGCELLPLTTMYEYTRDIAGDSMSSALPVEQLVEHDDFDSADVNDDDEEFDPRLKNRDKLQRREQDVHTHAYIRRLCVPALYTREAAIPHVVLASASSFDMGLPSTAQSGADEVEFLELRRLVKHPPLLPQHIDPVRETLGDFVKTEAETNQLPEDAKAADEDAGTDAADTTAAVSVKVSSDDASTDEQQHKELQQRLLRDRQLRKKHKVTPLVKASGLPTPAQPQAFPLPEDVPTSPVVSVVSPPTFFSSAPHSSHATSRDAVFSQPQAELSHTITRLQKQQKGAADSGAAAGPSYFSPKVFLHKFKLECVLNDMVHLPLSAEDQADQDRALDSSQSNAKAPAPVQRTLRPLDEVNKAVSNLERLVDLFQDICSKGAKDPQLKFVSPEADPYADVIGPQAAPAVAQHAGSLLRALGFAPSDSTQSSSQTQWVLAAETDVLQDGIDVVTIFLERIKLKSNASGSSPRALPSVVEQSKQFQDRLSADQLQAATNIQSEHKNFGFDVQDVAKNDPDNPFKATPMNRTQRAHERKLRLAASKGPAVHDKMGRTFREMASPPKPRQLAPQHFHAAPMYQRPALYTITGQMRTAKDMVPVDIVDTPMATRTDRVPSTARSTQVLSTARSVAGASVSGADMQLEPDMVNCGALKPGHTYRVTLAFINQGTTKGRFAPAALGAPIGRETSHTFLRLLYRMGPIAPGMRKRLELEVYAGERRADRGFFEHELVITTELHTFRLPIRGFVGTEAQYEAAMQKERARIQNRLKHTGGTQSDSLLTPLDTSRSVVSATTAWTAISPASSPRVPSLDNPAAVAAADAAAGPVIVGSGIVGTVSGTEALVMARARDQAKRQEKAKQKEHADKKRRERLARGKYLMTVEERRKLLQNNKKAFGKLGIVRLWTAEPSQAALKHIKRLERLGDAGSSQQSIDEEHDEKAMEEKLQEVATNSGAGTADAAAADEEEQKVDEEKEQDIDPEEQEKQSRALQPHVPPIDDWREDVAKSLQQRPTVV